jgi:excisionase family DNA binding protein
LFTLDNQYVRLLYDRQRGVERLAKMPSLQELERWMSTGQVANKLGYSRQYVIRLAEEKKLRAAKTAAGWLYDPDAVAVYKATMTSSKAR